MAKTAKDFPNVMQALGLNTDDDAQVEAFDRVIKRSVSRADAESAERLLKNGRSPENVVALVWLRGPVGSELARSGVRPDEVRRG